MPTVKLMLLKMAKCDCFDMSHRRERETELWGFFRRGEFFRIGGLSGDTTVGAGQLKGVAFGVT